MHQLESEDTVGSAVLYFDQDGQVQHILIDAMTEEEEAIVHGGLKKISRPSIRRRLKQLFSGDHKI